MNVVATESSSSESVWRWLTTIDLECIPIISHDPTRNSMKLLRKDSLSGSSCPLTSEDVRSSDKDNLTISWAPQHFRCPITPLSKFPRFEEPLSSPLSSFLYELVLGGLEVERGEPAPDYMTLII